MSRQALRGSYGVIDNPAHASEDSGQRDIRTQPHQRGPTPHPVCNKEEPDCAPNIHLSEPELSRTLYLGSARPFPQPTMIHERYNYSPSHNRSDVNWNVDHAHQAQQPPPQQHTFPAYQPNVLPRRGSKSPSNARRLVVQDFQALVALPADNFEILRDYVGADSRYTLAGTHAGIYVRSCVQSSDMIEKLRQTASVLTQVLEIFRFIHTIPKEHLKPEQRGCFTLRVCYGVLTALLGDFSNGSETPASDPQAPIIPRHQLPSFRSAYPKIQRVLQQLSEEFEISINTYRHRRSPSASVVTKLQGILRTLEAWNCALGDGTFINPTKIIDKWLQNHQAQVEGTRRMRVSSAHSSPSSSEPRPSPGQYDTSLFPSPIGIHNSGHPHPPSTHGNPLPLSVPALGYLPAPTPYNLGLFAERNNGTTFYPAPYECDLSGMYDGMDDMNLGYRQ